MRKRCGTAVAHGSVHIAGLRFVINQGVVTILKGSTETIEGPLRNIYPRDEAGLIIVGAQGIRSRCYTRGILTARRYTHMIRTPRC